MGETVGNFRIVAQLGRGGMGDVYRGEQVSVGSAVAIKMLSADLSADHEYVQRLFNEARAVNRIRHPGVVQIFDVGVAPAGRAYLIMELLDGETLRQALVRGRLDAGRIADLGKQLGSVLEATHAAGITHRDLKPDNIFLVPDPGMPGGIRVKVLDFGIAKLTGTLYGHSPRTSGTMGTPAYMAPEQWGDPARIDQRADLYSLGCVLFEMACGRPPFLVTTMAEACSKHMNEAPPRARTIAGDVPVPLEALFDRLLSKQPEARGSARDVMVALDGIAMGQAQTIDSQRTQATALPPPRPAPVERTKSRAPWLIAALLVLLIGGGITLAVANRDTSSVATSPSPTPQSPTPSPTTPPSPTGSASTVVVSPERQKFIEWLDKTNTWMSDGEIPAQYDVVRRNQYMRYLDTLDAQQRAWAKPLFRAVTDADDGPLTWITYEQAEAYCKAIGAKLPTNERWDRMDAARSGLNPGGIRIWTSSKTSVGQAGVRGFFAELGSAELEQERASHFLQWKDTEATAGGRDPIEKVASRQIGVRCVR